MTPESISIPADLLAETQAALDATVAGSADARGLAEEVKAKLSACVDGSCANMNGETKQRGYNYLRRLDELKRAIMKDHGLEK